MGPFWLPLPSVGVGMVGRGERKSGLSARKAAPGSVQSTTAWSRGLFNCCEGRIAGSPSYGRTVRRTKTSKLQSIAVVPMASPRLTTLL